VDGALVLTGVAVLLHFAVDRSGHVSGALVLRSVAGHARHRLLWPGVQDGALSSLEVRATVTRYSRVHGVRRGVTGGNDTPTAHVEDTRPGHSRRELLDLGGLNPTTDSTSDLAAGVGIRAPRDTGHCVRGGLVALEQRSGTIRHRETMVPLCSVPAWDATIGPGVSGVAGRALPVHCHSSSRHAMGTLEVVKGLYLPLGGFAHQTACVLCLIHRLAHGHMLTSRGAVHHAIVGRAAAIRQEAGVVMAPDPVLVAVAAPIAIKLRLQYRTIRVDVRVLGALCRRLVDPHRSARGSVWARNGAMLLVQAHQVLILLPLAGTGGVGVQLLDLHRLGYTTLEQKLPGLHALPILISLA